MADVAQSLTAWLHGRSDAELAELLRRRPDLALPAPADTAALAGRLSVRSSVQRALDGLDAHTLQVLVAIVRNLDSDPDSESGPDSGGEGPGRVVADEAASARAREELRALALLWGDGAALQPVPGVAELAGMQQPPHPGSPHPPQIRMVAGSPSELDRVGATAVLEALRLVEALVTGWTAHPPAQLRSGGVGVRDLRRTSRELGVPESTVALLAETAFAAGFVNATHEFAAVYLPTPEFDEWTEQPSAARWSLLARTWLAMTRQPAAVGRHDDRDRVVSLLGPEAERGTLPALRHRVLSVLAELPPGASPAQREDVLAHLAWRTPRRAAVEGPLAAAVLAEADLLGITARGGLTGYTRTLLDGSRAVAEQVLADALPVPVDEFVVQPDLTLVVPGPPAPALGRDLALMADLESSGGASVYRISEATVRRALDSGRSAADIHALLAQRSRTPVPQALRYLIDDAARRHGALRAGAAGAYLRSDDETLLARVAADRTCAALELRLLAPTVAVTPVPVARLLEVLRAAGYAPAAETAGGQVVTIRPEAARAPSRPVVRSARSRSVLANPSEMAALVRRMRAGDQLAAEPGRHDPAARTGAREAMPPIPGVTSATIMGRLREAIRTERLVVIGCADATGRIGRHTLLPISMGGGFVRGHEPGSEHLQSFPLHRLTAVAVLDGPAGDT